MRSPQSLIKSCLTAKAGRRDTGKLVNASIFRVASCLVLLKQRSDSPRQAETSWRHKELGTLWVLSWHPKPPLGLGVPVLVLTSCLSLEKGGPESRGCLAFLG